MLKKSFFLFILILVAIDALFFQFPKNHNSFILPQCVKQHGQTVQKDLWINEERAHLRLNSTTCDVFLSQKDKKIMFEEQLQNLICAIQDKIEDEGQEIRYFTSPHGQYQFPTQTLSLDDIDLFFFHFPGKLLPAHFNKENAYLTGKATRANLFISNKKPAFAIENLRLTQVKP